MEDVEPHTATKDSISKFSAPKFWHMRNSNGLTIGSMFVLLSIQRHQPRLRRGVTEQLLSHQSSLHPTLLWPDLCCDLDSNTAGNPELSETSKQGLLHGKNN